jgi:TRAP-type C4-dicarboxylate transport system substrate-binding protein
MDRRAFISSVSLGLLAAPRFAEAQGGYKPEFKMSVVVNEDTTWGRAAIRFADALRSRTAGRIQVKPYFNGQLFADEQTTEFRLLQQGGADFAIGSTINWSPQVKELNLFSMPFMFPNYGALGPSAETLEAQSARAGPPPYHRAAAGSWAASCRDPVLRALPFSARP